ncbi:unnamed protein product [Clonostachys solani]|uniref:Glycosyl transferase CAP10 domain-containing protein n=1 Tax=Clonostachys solani TaxID=160281 RepID=A0A9N9Z524_9HYPO|nr:unnamed protein product [Clonostachys solani]
MLRRRKILVFLGLFSLGFCAYSLLCLATEREYYLPVRNTGSLRQPSREGPPPPPQPPPPPPPGAPAQDGLTGEKGAQHQDIALQQQPEVPLKADSPAPGPGGPGPEQQRPGPEPRPPHHPPPPTHPEPPSGSSRPKNDRLDNQNSPADDDDHTHEHENGDNDKNPDEEELLRPPKWEVSERPKTKAGPGPLKVEDTSLHPISHLITEARREFRDIRGRQSKTLEEAVAEYRRRYEMPPPPNFDKWFKFATDNDVQLVDEFDTIHQLITPFWGLKPETIRKRAKEALGFDNALLGISIRNHEITLVEGGQEWQQNATQSMIEKFIEYIPDMDLAFNIHDEPRVVLSHEDLAHLVNKAKNTNMPAANAKKRPINDFSPRAPELSDGYMFDEVKRTRFNVFAHQSTWTNSRMSCPADSPAKTPDDDEQGDDRSRYGYSELGFVYNSTAMADICLSPSLSSSYGFFDRPNAFNVVHDLFPIFSQSKISSFSDLMYPSPWYWFDKVVYDEAKDFPWEQKDNKLYWRGSTTGGFSRNGGWRRQHRQQFVHKINAPDQAKILVNKGDEEQPNWRVSEVPRGKHRDLIDVHFSHIGQCDPGDCEAQIQYFTPTDHVDQQDAWKYKHLLDIDGNAFSGRFYAFLQSHSVTYKLALFREWHYEWLKPWVHYVPLSLQGDDWLEVVRYFAGSSAGDEDAEHLANSSTTWANRVLRKKDMEAWFFRLLLEYARVIDDNREIIGYDPSSSTSKLKKTNK